MNKRKNKQFNKAGQKQLTNMEQRLMLIMYKDSLKVEKRNTGRFQELLAKEVMTTSRLQKRLNSARSKTKKPENEAIMN